MACLVRMNFADSQQFNSKNDLKEPIKKEYNQKNRKSSNL